MSQAGYSTFSAGPGYVAPSPQPASGAFTHGWPSTSAPPTAHVSRAQSRSARPSRMSTPQPATPGHLQLAPGQFQPARPSASPAPGAKQGTWPQVPYAARKNMREQALWSTYSSRIRTGVSLLMQPIITAPTTIAAITIEKQMPQPITSSIAGERSSRRAAGKKVSYVDQGSSAEDEPEDDDGGPDAGEKVDSTDEDFVASGGVRTSLRKAGYTRGGRAPAAGTQTPQEEISQSYLGVEVPDKLLKWKRVPDGGYGHGAREMFGELNLGVNQLPPSRTSLVPITLSFNTPTHRVRDSFLWNIHENIINPQGFAKVMCADLELDPSYIDVISAQIETQIEEHLEVASADIHHDAMEVEQTTGEKPECRVIVSINVHIPPSQHLLDHIEWDLLSELTPEEFASKFCAEAGLGGESAMLITHALHEELLKHKKDAMDWGVLNPAAQNQQIRDKTGLGLHSASAWTKGGPGPRTLKSIWRDHAEAEEFQTKLQEMTEEEKERREVEQERFARRLKRDTSKFQSAGRSARRR